MPDKFINSIDNTGAVLPRRFKNMGDGTHAEVVYIIGSVSLTNYKTRLIKNGAGLTIGETREQYGVVEKQDWIYDGSGAYLGVDPWATV